MRALLIDPWTRTIREVEVEDDYRDIYKWLSRPDSKVRTFCLGGHWRNGDALYVDDEGLFKGGNRIFHVNGHNLSGMGLVLGSDHYGESVDAKISLHDMKSSVFWTDLMVKE